MSATDPPDPVCVPVQRRPSHALQLPADDAGSHRDRLRTQVPRVSTVYIVRFMFIWQHVYYG